MTPAEHRVAIDLNGEGGIGFDARCMKGETACLIGREMAAGDQVKEVTKRIGIPPLCR